MPNGTYRVTVSSGDQPGPRPPIVSRPATTSCIGQRRGRCGHRQFPGNRCRRVQDRNRDDVPVTDGTLTVDATGVPAPTPRSTTWTVESVDVTAPAIPAGVEATAGDGKVDLTWAAVAADDLKGYLVYRSDERHGRADRGQPAHRDPGHRDRSSPTPPSSTRPRTTTSSSPIDNDGNKSERLRDGGRDPGGHHRAGRADPGHSWRPPGNASVHRAPGAPATNATDFDQLPALPVHHQPGRTQGDRERSSLRPPPPSSWISGGHCD